MADWHHPVSGNWRQEDPGDASLMGGPEACARASLYMSKHDRVWTRLSPSPTLHVAHVVLDGHIGATSDNRPAYRALGSAMLAASRCALVAVFTGSESA